MNHASICETMMAAFVLNAMPGNAAFQRALSKGNRDYTGMWVRLGSTDLMAGKVVFLRGLLSLIRVVDLTILGDVQTTTPEGECTM
ncbi:hypothetical protein TNCV_39041 [Trichonephila clavipes]|nr:hypothetical protein TNCV_39041 [Trichonephila clavipes]